MAVRHINPHAKAESGVILSGKEAAKVFSLFDDAKRSSAYVESKKQTLKEKLRASIKKAS